jgi:hypothetical protein
MAAVTYLSPTSFSVPGNFAFLFPQGKALMALLSVKTKGIWVVSASYDAPSLSTIVYTIGAALDSSLSGVIFGQDVDNAPYNPLMTGATAAADGGPGRVPAPGAGQQNNLLAGDGTYHDPIVDIQVWS